MPFKGNPNIPKMCPLSKNPTIEQIVATLLMASPMTACTEVPNRCQENASFVLDNLELGDCCHDFKSDDLGKFKNNGVQHCYVSVVRNTKGKISSIKKLSSKPHRMVSGMFYVKRTYWKHSVDKDFTKRYCEMFDDEGNRTRFSLLMYCFENEEHTITVPPRKRAKNAKPYFRTKPSVVLEMKKRLENKKRPSVVYDEVFELGGGVMGMKSTSSVPRNVEQVKNINRNTTAGGKLESAKKDELFLLISKGKDEEDSGNAFIRNVQASPFPACVLATNGQLEEIVKHCTNPDNFSVLGIDTTYNIGNFYVTPTTYRHQMLEMRQGKNSKCPTMLGPVLLHQRKTSTAFSYFADTIANLQPDTKNVLAVGTDRDDALNGFCSKFPISSRLLCIKHFKDDIVSKLTSLGIKSPFKEQILADIFGNSSAKELGLVDKESGHDVDDALFLLREKWNDREKASRGTDDVVFFDWFVKYQVNDLKDGLLYPLRRDVGLGYDFFYNNANESVNEVIKKEAERKKKGWIDCIEVIRSITDRQERNVQRAIVDQGPYKLKEEYRHLQIDADKWCEADDIERERLIKRFKRATLKARDVVEVSSKRGVTSDQLESPNARDNADDESDDVMPTSGISFTASKLPDGTYQNVWNQAISLARAKSENIVQLPGNTDGRVVRSKNNPQKPHIVTFLQSGKGHCSDCPVQKERSICQHTIAAAEDIGILEKHLEFFHRLKEPLNMMTSARRNVPSNSGQKPGQKQRKPRGRGHSRNEGEHAQRTPTSSKSSNSYNLRWLAETRAYICYGCKKALRVRPHIPPVPFDVVLTRKEMRMYKNRSGELTYSIKPEPVFYHLRKSCVLKKNENFTKKDITIGSEDLNKLCDRHKDHIRHEFGLVVN